jgi:hypothetical protein
VTHFQNYVQHPHFLSTLDVVQNISIKQREIIGPWCCVQNISIKQREIIGPWCCVQNISIKLEKKHAPALDNYGQSCFASSDFLTRGSQEPVIAQLVNCSYMAMSSLTYILDFSVRFFQPVYSV